MKIRPVILSGGSGTRLWPVSRARLPKQFVPLGESEGLMADTLRLVTDRNVFAPPMIVGNADHKFLIRDVLDKLGIVDADVLLEPVGRNTAPAALAAALAEKDPNVLHLVMPSDHIIKDRKAYYEALRAAAPAAQDGMFVLFGISPTYPETGYGYITAGADTAHRGVKKLNAFKEKPDARTAEDFIRQGAVWNSGIFLYAPQTLIAEAETLAAPMLANIREASSKAQSNAQGIFLDTAAYTALPSEPFDRVIMERTQKGAVVPCAIGWSDVGSWQALWQLADKDANGNVLGGAATAVDVKDSYIRTEGPAIAVLGLDNIAVVATKDAVLITPRNRAQDVKTLVGAVEKSQAHLTAEHVRAQRPWGTYETVARGPLFQVKQIIVYPGRSLSLQMHHHRAEHWVVVAGTAKVECDDLEKMVFPNESVYIPKGARHRLTNPGIVDLHLIEVQSGDYLGEDDIVRFADNYGRTG